MADELLDRIRVIEDRLALNELVARYCVVLDNRDFAALGQLFTRDCVFDSVEGRTSGRGPVMEYYRKRMDSFGPTFHIPHGHCLETLRENEAQGILTAHAELAIDGTTFVVALRYYDHYRREDGSWRFHERRVKQLYALPLSDLPSGLASTLRIRWPGTQPAKADLPESEDAV